ncbi:MAG TPA: MBL fold metallo-hydrolase [Acidimicrobiales bacterium]|nr:MBL fold metallo-hydrolase [Acidimicrobiales bacterium]
MTTTLDWYGCATFALRTAGLTIFLDAYVDRAEGAAGPQPRVGADDVGPCDWIVVGHSHFDHVYGAERIARTTGARIIGSYETVRVLEQAGVPVDQMICVAGGETVALADDVRVSVFPSQHSCVWSQGGMRPADEVCLGDLGLTWQQQQDRFAAVVQQVAEGLPGESLRHFLSAQQGDRGDGGALVYLFDTPDGRLLYQDTSGHWRGMLGGLRPDAAIIAAAGRGNVDGEPAQGSLAEFVAAEVELLGPRKVVLCHHDDWLPGFSIDTDIGPIRDELARRVPDVALLELGYLDGTAILP